MTGPSPQKMAEWKERASRKDAIVPEYFEVTPTTVSIVCGKCKRSFGRNLIPGLDEPVFVCPNEKCRARNWVPIAFDLK